jgi:hypothetical protein
MTPAPLICGVEGQRAQESGDQVASSAARQRVLIGRVDDD